MKTVKIEGFKYLEALTISSGNYGLTFTDRDALAAASVIRLLRDAGSIQIDADSYAQERWPFFQHSATGDVVQPESEA